MLKGTNGKSAALRENHYLSRAYQGILGDSREFWGLRGLLSSSEETSRDSRGFEKILRDSKHMNLMCKETKGKMILTFLF